MTNTNNTGGDTGFVEAVKKHCPWMTPRQLKGIDPTEIKVCVQAAIWSARGFKGVYPSFNESEIKQYLQGE